MTKDKNLSVKFLGDEYSIDLQAGKVVSLACNVPAKDFTAILILHYLSKKIKGLPELKNEWVSFKELSGIEGYAPAFRNRAIEPVIRKYGVNPQSLPDVLERLPGKKSHTADASIIVEAFEGVPVLVELWAGDEEFGPEANMLFDESIIGIFCTEDTVVLAGLVAAAL
ncbi:MAG: DUF3786 domain-containing protein [Candidatus Omnitrophica bacterium]|nr:DUF3786 domain-containing protein [Candidatus Omnitrophota bacterium]